jgi:hypothetical protein
MRWWLLALGVGLALALAGACRIRTIDEIPRDGAPSPDDGPMTGDGPPIDARPIDAMPGLTCNPAACSAAGGTCTAEQHCRIQNNGAGGVTCPLGHYCDVICLGSSCRNGLVNCLNGVGCNVTCGSGGAADDACDSGVRCPTTGPCTITCNGGLA